MTRKIMAKAFNEWMRRYTEEPERFEREYQSVGAYLEEIARGEEPTYGDACAGYLTQIVTELEGAVGAGQ
jgi:hypothetical protein